MRSVEAGYWLELCNLVGNDLKLDIHNSFVRSKSHESVICWIAGCIKPCRAPLKHAILCNIRVPHNNPEVLLFMQEQHFFFLQFDLT
jgi:hypothetical protein